VSAGTTGEPAAEGARRSAHAAVSRQIAPTLHQRELGMRLRALRVERGLSVEEVAERLLCTPSRIRQLEAAESLPTETDLRDFRTLFKLDDATADLLTGLAREAGQQGWWAHYQDLGTPYIGLEQHASSITSYAMQYFPALLQTGDYARAIIKVIAPQIEPKILEQRVEARLRRQHVLSSSNTLRYAALLDEAVLRRPVGAGAVMYKQLDKVLTMIRAHKVDLRIVPFERGAGVAQDSNFVFLQFDEPGPLPVVYIEGLAADHFLEGEQDVNRYLEEIERLKQSALDSGDSVERIVRARDFYRNDWHHMAPENSEGSR
jgi:transcriptional regulator with XRE-family HTH domain